MNSTEFTQACISANKEIYTLVQNRKDDHYKKDSVGAGGDVSIGIDLLAEKVFVKYLGRFGKIDSEESGIIGSGEYTIYIDPIDGSANYCANFPYFGTSVALEGKKGVEIGVICNLASGEIFIKTKPEFNRGHLSKSGFERVKANNHDKLGIFEKAYAHPGAVDKLHHAGIKYRSPGAGAISLAMTHDVSFLLYIGALRSYDVKAGLFMCEDLHCEIRENFLLVSKDEETFNKIKSLFAEAL